MNTRKLILVAAALVPVIVGTSSEGWANGPGPQGFGGAPMGGWNRGGNFGGGAAVLGGALAAGIIAGFANQPPGTYYSGDADSQVWWTPASPAPMPVADRPRKCPYGLSPCSCRAAR